MFTASRPPSIVASVTSALTQVEARPELRKFFVQDGFGILLVKEAGIEVCLITMSDTPAIRKRIDRLKIRFGHMGVRDKLPKLQAICAELGIGLEDRKSTRLNSSH